MEESKPSVSTPSPNEARISSGDADAFELRFAELCKVIYMQQFSALPGFLSV